MARSSFTPVKIVLVAAFLISLMLTCILIAVADGGSWLPGSTEINDSSPGLGEIIEASLLENTETPEPLPTPTPDLPKLLPTLRSQPEEYIVQPGDSLNQIAQAYTVSVAAIVEANEISQPDLLEVGQVLTIPAPQPVGTGPAFKVIPDSELVYGPASEEFDLAGYVLGQGGYLSDYREVVDESISPDPLSPGGTGDTGVIQEGEMTGIEIVERVAREFSINPRLILAVLEHQSGWVTQADPDETTLAYPMGVFQEWRNGLYRQLAWAADNLNRGYYLWRVNGVGAWILAGGELVLIDPAINAGTAGVQHLYSELLGYQDWRQAVTDSGLYGTYRDLFGDPFRFAYEPLLPADLRQPAMQLPFEKGKRWSFTGGPHGGWGSGSAWAALDFAPPGDALGCVDSNAWVVALADGLILRADHGAVVQDLDNDGLEGTGWTILYMHIETRDRVRPGTQIKAGERIGHPSCEGGFSTGTHVHLARRYNGEWIPADQAVPFDLDGWVSEGLGREYDGLLVKDDKTIEAWEGRVPANEIRR